MQSYSLLNNTCSPYVMTGETATHSSRDSSLAQSNILVTVFGQCCVESRSDKFYKISNMYNMSEMSTVIQSYNHTVGHTVQSFSVLDPRLDLIIY